MSPAAAGALRELRTRHSLVGVPLRLGGSSLSLGYLGRREDWDGVGF